jgi:CSLREA domain-containing protein
MTRGRRLRALGRGAVGIFACVGAAAEVQSATFVVNSAADPGNGACDVAECTLREAITAANAAAGPDLVNFAIPGGGPHVIALASALPNVSSPITIDGYTQPGSAPNTRTPEQGGSDAILAIEIRPAPATTITSGLVFFTTYTLRGVVIGGFTQAILVSSGSGGTHDDRRIEGVFVGLATDGTTPIAPAGSIGISISAPTRIGGSTPAARNVVAGYANSGINNSTTDLVIEGNVIGLDATGTRIDVTASGNAIDLNAPTVIPGTAPRIGGPSPAQRNVIFARGTAVGIACPGRTVCYDGGLVQGNYLNVDASGGPLVSASSVAVAARAEPAGAFVIGGPNPGEGNVIGSPWNYGVVLLPGFSGNGKVAVLGNRFVHLSGIDLPIRLTADNTFNASPLANDAGDADAGANALQNHPDIVDVRWDETTTTIRYRVDSTAAASAYPLRVDFYQITDGSMTGRSASDSYAIGDAQSERTVVLPVRAGELLPFRATATDAGGATSELTPGVFGDAVFSDGFESEPLE